MELTGTRSIYRTAYYPDRSHLALGTRRWAHIPGLACVLAPRQPPERDHASFAASDVGMADDQHPPGNCHVRAAEQALFLCQKKK